MGERQWKRCPESPRRASVQDSLRASLSRSSACTGRPPPVVFRALPHSVRQDVPGFPEHRRTRSLRSLVFRVLLRSLRSLKQGGRATPGHLMPLRLLRAAAPREWTRGSFAPSLSPQRAPRPFSPPGYRTTGMHSNVAEPDSRTLAESQRASALAESRTRKHASDARRRSRLGMSERRLAERSEARLDGRAKRVRRRATVSREQASARSAVRRRPACEGFAGVSDCRIGS
jgi:hypothetical protein